MACALGTELIERYERAVRDRELAKDILLKSRARKFKVEDHPFEDLMLIAKQKYSEALVAWVGHRGSCVSCQATFGANDRVQFASV